ncbi:hypothetical protein MKX03_029696 [Papaver bracteatum]|nr:hypothetical protein MKX03_029696 [Papaver bracteatum]
MEMMSKQNIREFREKLDKTLACNDLVDEESIKKLVVRQFSLSPSNQSANDEYRVMYREGLQGSPFHTLLVEGYADAPVDVCICAAWETSLYRKWWPQITIPTFRVTEAILLQKIRIGEHLSLMRNVDFATHCLEERMKVTWPLSAREVIVHYLEIEYFEADLVIGLLNSVPDTDKVTNGTHGFSNKGIPEAKDIVRMDIIGGTVMKKLSTNKTYFRTMAKMDLKLDFVPARLINFIARQILGGTCKLYQKTVASVAKGDEDFEEALKDPLYVRIREGLYSGKKLKNISENKNGESILALSELHEIGEDALEPVQSGLKEVEEQQNELYSKGKKEDATEPDESGLEGNEKIDTELDQSDLKGHEGVHRTTTQAVEQYNGNGGSEKKIPISLQVQEALEMLDNLMGMVQKGDFGEQSSYDVECVNPEHVNSESVNTKVGLTSSINDKQEMNDISKGMEEANSDNDAHNSRSKPTYTSRELENNSTAPASPLGNNVPLAYNENDALKPSQDNEEVGVKVNATHEGSPNHGREKSGQKKRWRYSCVHFTASLI